MVAHFAYALLAPNSVAHKMKVLIFIAFPFSVCCKRKNRQQDDGREVEKS